MNACADISVHHRMNDTILFRKQASMTLKLCCMSNCKTLLLCSVIENVVCLQKEAPDGFLPAGELQQPVGLH